MAADAYGQKVGDAVPTPLTGDVVADLTSQIVRLADFYATPRGRVIAQLMAAATGERRGADVLKERFFAERRRAAIELVREGMANGQLRPDLDPDLSIDVLFGAMVFRLFNGEAPLQREPRTPSRGCDPSHHRHVRPRISRACNRAAGRGPTVTPRRSAEPELRS